MAPRFEIRTRKDAAVLPSSGSPARRLLDWNEAQGVAPVSYSWTDPYAGAGGFGASTAEFAAIYAATLLKTGEPLKWWRGWTLYRELMGGSSLLPSGADLVAQLLGGTILFDSFEADATDLSQEIARMPLMVFSAAHQTGRKTATHVHLGSLNGVMLLGDSPLMSSLRAPLEDGVQALREGDVQLLAHALRKYADILNKSHLEDERTTADRLALSEIPGVLAVKGAGANQSDAVWILTEAEGEERWKIIAEAEARGLRLVQDGFQTPEKGCVAE